MTAQLFDNDTLPELLPSMDGENRVEVRLNELIVGRSLTYPIYDEEGLLLLAEGSTITSEFRKLLGFRGVTCVRMHADDANRVRLNLDTNGLEEQDGISLDSQLADRLDRIIDSGLMTLSNSGPSVRESVVFHGRKAYNIERHEAYKQQREATCESLDNMMKEAMRGKSVSSTVVNSLAAQYLSDMTDDTDCVLASVMEASRDESLSKHSLKMSALGLALGIEMGLNEDNCKRIAVAGLIHDWGMVKIPAALRTSARTLSENEFFQIKKHPIYTAEMLERMPGIPSMVPVIVYQVHERPNGLGYPRGRLRDRIHLFARILAVADCYTALTEPRAYRPPLAPYAAMECLIRLAKDRDVDSEVVRALLKVMNLFPIGSYVALNDGSVAQVIRRNRDLYTKPIVQVIQDCQGNSVPAGIDEAVIDLSESELTVSQALPTPGRNEQLLSEVVLHPVRNRV